VSEHLVCVEANSLVRRTLLAALVLAAGHVIDEEDDRALSPSFWRDFRTAGDVIVRRGNMGPLFAQVPGLLEISARALRRRCGLLAAATADIEWDGQMLNAMRP